MPDGERLVLDSSVAISWCFADESSPYGDAVLRSLPTAPAIVPSLWTVEIANALLIGERRRRCTQADTVESIHLLRGLPISVDVHSHDRALDAVLEVARSHNLSAYDAAYLELAMRRGLPLATVDRRLRDAAAPVGVPLYEP